MKSIKIFGILTSGFGHEKITSNEPWNTETKRIEIHQSQITNNDLLNLLKPTLSPATLRFLPPVTWKHIPTDMRYPTWETHIPSNMCSLPGKHISLVICVPPPAKHVSLIIYISLPGKHVSLVICAPPPKQQISLVICVPPPGKSISLVICVPLPGKHISLVMSVPYLGNTYP